MKTLALTEQAKTEIKELFLRDDDGRHLSLAFSGGKDSSLILALSLECLLGLTEEHKDSALHQKIARPSR